MSYDRDEWRRPWRAEETPEAPSGRPGASPDSDTEADASAGQTQPGAQWAAATSAPVGSSTATSAATGHATQPLARFPQPPPAGFDDSAAGPGSPLGSVRPPDVTGTVDPPQPRRRRGVVGVAIAALFGAILGTAATLALVLPQETASEPVESEAPGATDVNAPSIEVAGDGGTIVPAVAQAVTPSVVTVDVGGSAATGRSGSLGSGVIYRSDGYILTNHHVIEPAIEGEIEVTVRLASGDILDAEIIGSDELNDLAVLRIDRTGLPAINLRPEEEPLIVGETVVAVGSPFGLDTSVTAGIISALNRELRIDEVGTGLVIPSVIQTDAAINPGNSGGALVDAEGRLVGINTAILTQTGASQGVGFAVSWEQAISSADQLIADGFVRHPLLGIQGRDVTPEVAEEFGLPASRGAVIEDVQSGTGAAEAGLRPGDIIVEFNEEPLATMSQLVAQVRRLLPGDEVELVIIRDGERVEVDVVLSER